MSHLVQDIVNRYWYLVLFSGVSLWLLAFEDLSMFMAFVCVIAVVPNLIQGAFGTDARRVMLVLPISRNTVADAAWVVLVLGTTLSALLWYVLILGLFLILDPSELDEMMVSPAAVPPVLFCMLAAQWTIILLLTRNLKRAFVMDGLISAGHGIAAICWIAVAFFIGREFYEGALSLWDIPVFAAMTFLAIVGFVFRRQLVLPLLPLHQAKTRPTKKVGAVSTRSLAAPLGRAQPYAELGALGFVVTLTLCIIVAGSMRIMGQSFSGEAGDVVRGLYIAVLIMTCMVLSLITPAPRSFRALPMTPFRSGKYIVSFHLVWVTSMWLAVALIAAITGMISIGVFVTGFLVCVAHVMLFYTVSLVIPRMRFGWFAASYMLLFLFLFVPLYMLRAFTWHIIAAGSALACVAGMVAIVHILARYSRPYDAEHSRPPSNLARYR